MKDVRLTLSRSEARRLAIQASGLARRRQGTPGRHQVLRAIARLNLLQMDSVSIVARAHYLPLFSRLGSYAPALLDEAAWGRRRSLFEYWAHEASLLPLSLHPLLRWRMARAQAGQGIYAGLAEFARERPEAIARALTRIRSEGALVASDLEGSRGAGGWWGWSEAKRALEWLFWAGHVTTAERRSFARVYDLTERVLPTRVLDEPTPPEDEAHRRLLLLSAQALGIATAGDLRDYFRLNAADAAPRLAELVEAGTLLPVAVEGWSQTGYLSVEAAETTVRLARNRPALLAPFDPLVWHRPRVERLFGFRYRIEIYTPATLRQHGYYVLPFLLGDRLVARVDLKAERAQGCLRVLATHGEPGAPRQVAAALGDELRTLAGWLGLDRVLVDGRGDLAAPLQRAMDGTPERDGPAG